MIEQIIKLADHLDSIGASEEASILDRILPYIKNVEIEHPDHHEGGDVNYMVQPQLISISHKAAKISQMIEEGAKVDDWMETYIAQVDLMMDNIFDKIGAEKIIEEKSMLPCGCDKECSCLE